MLRSLVIRSTRHDFFAETGDIDIERVEFQATGIAH